MHHQESCYGDEFSYVLYLLCRNDAYDLWGDFFETLDVVVECAEFAIRSRERVAPGERNVQIGGGDFFYVLGGEEFFRKICGLERGVSFEGAFPSKINYNKTRTGVKCQCEFMQGFSGQHIFVRNGEKSEPALVVKAF